MKENEAASADLMLLHMVCFQMEISFTHPHVVQENVCVSDVFCPYNEYVETIVLTSYFVFYRRTKSVQV